MTVAFLAPNPPQNIFWGTLYKIMQAAADDLDIELTIHYSKANTYSFKKDGSKILAAHPKPDYFVTGYWNGVTVGHLAEAEARGIKTFVINTEISKEETRLAGAPRGRYSQWIGHMRPDDQKAGYDLAKTLIAAAAEQGIRNMHVAGVGGGSDSDVSNQRERGFARAVGEANNVVSRHEVLGMWEQPVTSRALEKLLAEEARINVVWTASDAMALGSVDALKAAGKTPGRDAFVGGIDWSATGIDAVARGELVATYGGHFMEGAWALILLYDYHHGRDFAREPGVSAYSTMYPITSDNAKAYKQVFEDQSWSKVDFRKFSKVLNPSLREYVFTPAMLLHY